MRIFMLLTVLTVIMNEAQKAMEDKFVSVREVVDIADKASKEILGKGIDDIGLRISQTEDGKTKVEFVV